MSSTSSMGVSRTPEQAEQASPTFLPNNPFAPPKGGICLINDLPPELLSCIFEFGSTDDGIIGKDEDAFAESESSNVSLPFTFLVSHVCRHWRNIALSTPSFWTTIAVTPKARPPYERVSTLLERSKGLPIDLILFNTRFDTYVDVYKPFPPDFEFLLAMLIPHIHRWRTMEVTVLRKLIMQILLSAVSDPSVPAASQLMTLELYDLENVDLPYFRRSKHLTLFSGSAPLLTRIVLWGVHVDWDQPWIASASNLTDLMLAYHPEAARPSLTQFSTILRNAPALEKLHLRHSGPARDRMGLFIVPPSAADFDPPIQLARLADLILASSAPARVTWLHVIRNFTFPALKNLVLDLGKRDNTEFIEELARPTPSLSASRASCSALSGLESLKLARLRCSDESIKTLYGELQNLRSLNLSLSRLNPLFLDILSTRCTLPGRGNVWLPRLVTLYISGTSGCALRELVSERREVGTPLSALFVTERCAVDDEDVEWFKENMKTFETFQGIHDAGDDLNGWNDDANED